MIVETKELLTREGITHVAVIDDAYDEPSPSERDISDEQWTRFFSDITEADEEMLRTAVGAERYDSTDDSHLRRDPIFMRAVWDLRPQSAAARELFAEFERDHDRKRAELEPLQAALQELGVAPVLMGSGTSATLLDAEIVFLDLFLGRDGDTHAVEAAIARVKGLVSERRDKPPAVILMSASPTLASLATKVRDDAELLGCQFRTLRKSSLRDSSSIAEQVHDLVASMPDAGRLNKFLLAWDAALTAGRREFVRRIRTLDLADYANLHALALEAEGEPVGDYILDLCDLHLHSLMESNATLMRAARDLNEVVPVAAVPGHLKPADELERMADGAMFHHETRTNIERENRKATDVEIGDVFLDRVAPLDGGGRRAFVVLTPACDLQHGELDRILLLEGTARPYAWKLTVKPKDGDGAIFRTPIMYFDENAYSIDWSIVKPQTWTMDDLSRATATFVRARRFRIPFVLQLQQQFLSRVGRVGTPVMPPARFAVAVRAFVRIKGRNEARLLVDESADAENGSVALIGRGAHGTREWLLLSDSARTSLRDALQNVPKSELTADVLKVRDDPAFYRRLKYGLAYARNPDGQRPLDGDYKILVITTNRKLGDGSTMPGGPLVIEVDAP